MGPFSRLVDQVMTVEPYASADRVFWIVDNGSSHRGQASIDRMHNAWPNAHLVHLPIHASWLDQVEIYFSVVQRKVVAPTTSPTSIRSVIVLRRSRTATTPSPRPSTGASPAPTSRTSSTASPATRPLFITGSRHDPRRINESDH
jgi:hypothetical protein